MSELKLCQGTECHTYRTKDRIRGSQGDKHYETRRRSNFYYGVGNFCSWQCLNDWNSKFMELALNRFGRTTEPKRQDCRNAWYKDYTHNYDHTNNRSNYTHYIVNDLIGKKVPITEQQYNDDSYKLPLNTS